VVCYGIVSLKNGDESAINEMNNMEMNINPENKLYEDEKEYKVNTGIQE
jgi:hypothetical protein